MSLLAEVVISSKTRMTDRRFTYLIPEALRESVQIGARVEVPFGRGNRKHTALILRLEECSESNLELKPIWRVVDRGFLLSDESVAIAEFMVKHYLSDYTSAFSAVLPPGMAGAINPKLKRYYQITAEGLHAQVPERAVKQRAVLDALLGGAPLERSRLLTISGASAQTLKSLVERGWLSVRDRRIARRSAQPMTHYERLSLNAEQQAIYDRISSHTGRYLICGVTGSGKTEIYLQLVEDCLNAGKQAIVLVPEISLTPQTIARFEGRFHQQIAILHSRLSVAERYEEWEKIANGEVDIVVGARSAIFAPFTSIGLIIIDEEHEQSYISEQNPKYHTHDIARLRCEHHGCSLVLGSATPSIETLHAASIGEYTRLDLKRRANRLALPGIEVIDMREELKANNRTMFSRSLYAGMHEALERREQIILFLNKRGHSSFVFCRKCGYVYRCDACDVAMTYHKHRHKLICHYCGREKAAAHRCPQCGSEAIKAFGAGTEMLEQEVRRYFPQARVCRADGDTMKRKGAYDRIYSDMLNGSIDILIGTQMIAKGFDFPNVTVVGVISADITLNLPDIRASERTFQLLTQVAGRAGRGAKGGNVYIQTYKPAHYAIGMAASHDIDGFFAQECAHRRASNYPPFTRELSINLSGADRRACYEMGAEIRRSVDALIEAYRSSHPDALFRVDGPTPAVIERIDRRYRFGLLIRHQDRAVLRAMGERVIADFPTSQALHIVVTLDPQNIY